MISTTRRPDGRNYCCDDCKRVIKVFKNYPAAIASGWAISRDRQKCYCPTCAPKHRNTGRGGAPVTVLQPSWVPTGMQQTTIDIKGN